MFVVDEDEVRETQEKVYKEYPAHWVCVLKDMVLPPQFDYMVYGRVLDTRKVYLMMGPQGVTDKFQLYYDKSKFGYEEFLQIEILG